MLLVVAAACAGGAARAAETIGVVLLHGKGGLPSGAVASLVVQLRAAGLAVEAPEMPYSQHRRYDGGYERAVGEIHDAVTRLRARGATRIFVGGHSMGANVAIGYALRHDGVAGLVLLAPGHVPGNPGFDRRMTTSVDRARALSRQGRGQVREQFSDLNTHGMESVTATADDYLSWFAPDGPAAFKSNVARLRTGLPVLCVDGSTDKTPHCVASVLAKLPARTSRKHVVVRADHVGVPAAAVESVRTWIAAQ